VAKPDPALLDAARYPFDLEITTRFADLDPNDHINNVAIAAVLEDARVRFNEALGFRTVIRSLRAMVASVSIDYLAQGITRSRCAATWARSRSGGRAGPCSNCWCRAMPPSPPRGP
jgi:hypothetical protein